MMKLKKPWALRDAKASPLGRGGIAQAMTERHWLLSERCYRCAFCFMIASLPSQSPSVTALPEGEPLAWRAVLCRTPEA